jgi:eukaryotic-like serine/threonine-protein kinase
MIQQLGDALTCLHKQNLTHRDVKPENIMLRKRGMEAVLIDFGLARQATLSGKLMTNSSRGTEHYAPIELAEQRPQLGAYTDVYSLAATLYNMLTDNKPIPSPGRKIIDPFIQRQGECRYYQRDAGGTAKSPAVGAGMVGFADT